jgi:phytoene desaturase
MKREKYDVVVIGSGMGGLSAAALLTQEGYETLLVERLPRLGGRYSSIERKGFKLTTGAIAVETGGLIEHIFSAIGAKFEVRQAGPWGYMVDGVEYEMPLRGGLKHIISHLGGDEKEAETVMNAIKRGLSWQEPSDSISFREWLLQYTENERIFDVFWSFISLTLVVNDYELPAGEFFRYLKVPRSQGIGIAPEGNLALMGSLAEAIQAKGGIVWTSCRAQRIMVVDGIARGIVVEREGEEREIMAKAVVSNAGPQRTVELAGKDNFDRGYLKQLAQTFRPSPGFLLIAATDRPLTEHPISYLIGARRVNSVFCPTLVCPELAPEGKHLFEAGGIPRSSLPPYEFKRDKEAFIQDLRENFRDFDKHAEILRFGYYREDWPGHGCWPGYDPPQKTPIENLYNVGDGVKPRGWVALSACAKSAEIVMEDIKGRFKPGQA